MPKSCYSLKINSSSKIFHFVTRTTQLYGNRESSLFNTIQKRKTYLPVPENTRRQYWCVSSIGTHTIVWETLL